MRGLKQLRAVLMSGLTPSFDPRVSRLMPLDKSMPLLVLEQRGTYSQLIEDMLRALGFDKVDCAADGETAIELLQGSTPKLLIADLHLEPMSGLQLLRNIRAHPRLHRCPFVMTDGALTPVWTSTAGS